MSERKDTTPENSQVSETQDAATQNASVIEGTAISNSSTDQKSEKTSQSTFKKQAKSDVLSGSASNTTSSSETQKPQSSSGYKKKTSSQNTSKSKSTTQTSARKKTSWLMSLLLWLLVLLGVVMLLYVLQNSQAIDELRNDLNQVQSKQTSILDQQDSLLADSAGQQANQQVAALKTQFEQLQTRVDSLKQQPAEAPTSDLQAIEQQQAQLEAKLQTQLEQMQSQLETLSTPTQTVEGEVDLAPVLQKMALLEKQLTELEAQEATAKQATIEKVERSEALTDILDLQALQQSILETNTQWLLGASTAATIDKLNSIEKMAVNGGLPKITVLSRLIGEDVAYLKNWYEIDQQPLPSLDKLTQAVGNIAPPKIELKQAETTPTAVESEVNTDAIAVGEVAEQEGAWARLLTRLSEMVTVKNRQTTGEPTTVEALLQHDIQKQRLMLLIEQMRWSAEHDSQRRFESSIDQVQKFVNMNFANYSSQFETLLKPFRAFERQDRQPLATAGFHVKPAGQ